MTKKNSCRDPKQGSAGHPLNTVNPKDGTSKKAAPHKSALNAETDTLPQTPALPAEPGKTAAASASAEAVKTAEISECAEVSKYEEVIKSAENEEAAGVADGEILPEDDDVLSDNEEAEDGGGDGGMFEHFRFVIDKGQSLLRVDKYITEHMEKTSRHRIQSAIEAGYVMVNGKTVKANYKVKPLDIVAIVLPYQRRVTEIRPENIPLKIAYEDEHLLVIDKPAGLVVHPGFGHFSGTLVNALAWHLGIEQGPGREDERMGILVHRIDKNTSGLLVVAKNDRAQLHLAKQFFDHTIQRNYVALVWGNVKEDEGTVTGNIGRDPNDRLRFKVFPDGENGKHAVTHYKVLERFGYVTLIECRLETGRTHQIRVHMNYLGHPLFNDERYGGDRIRKGTLYTKYKQFIDNCFEMLPRHALHARTLGFIHPATGQPVFLESPVPPDMAALIEKWRGYSRSRFPEEE